MSSPKGLQLASVITRFVIERLTNYGSVCSNSLLKISITKYISKKKKLEQKQEKEEIVPKDFYFIYCAVNAKLETIYKKHLIDSVLNSPRIRLSQSQNIIMDTRDTKESFVDCVSPLKRKKTDCLDVYFTILEATQFLPTLVINRNAKAKQRGTWIPFKSEKVSLN